MTLGQSLLATGVLRLVDNVFRKLGSQPGVTLDKKRNARACWSTRATGQLVTPRGQLAAARRRSTCGIWILEMRKVAVIGFRVG